MDTYEREIFNYFSRKENFTAAYEMHQLFPKIRKELINLFWQTVKNSLEQETKDSDWLVRIDDDVFSTYSKLGIQLKSDKDGNIRVIFEQLHGRTYYGVWLNIENKSLDVEQIKKKYSKKILSIPNLNSARSEYWLGYTYIGEDFNNIDTLKKTLSENREAFAKELVTLLLNLGDDVKEDVGHMCQMII